MTRVRPVPSKDLFLAALRVRPAARDAFVRRWAAGRDDVLAEVRTLLAAAADGSPSLRAPSIARRAVEDLADGRPLGGEPAVGAPAAPPAAPAAPEGFAPGGRFADFDVEAEIGVGGFGRVFRARDRVLGRVVALKVLRVRDIGPAASTERRRFLREARALAAIVHPNVAVLYRVHPLDDGGLVLEMEHVAGPSLAHALPDGRALPPPRALAIARDVAAGLRAAHGAGVVHGDVKPSNVVRASGGGVKLVDFGLARFVGAESQRSGSGVVAGTPDFMAPEVITGGALGPAADVWSLGILLHRMLAGAFPFRGETIQRLFARIVHDEPEPPPEACPSALRPLVSACLAKDPSRRPALDDAFLDALRVPT